MSYDIRLMDPVTHEVIRFEMPHQMRGGTYCMGGTTEAWLNITYNYSDFYYEYHEKGIRVIYGMTGAESIAILREMIACMKANHPQMETDPDYWHPCAGNAVKPLYQLIALAQLRPDGVWEGD